MIVVVKGTLWAILAILLTMMIVTGNKVLIGLAIVVIPFIGAAAVAATIFLPADPKDRQWEVEIRRTPGGVWKWGWRLLADGEPGRNGSTAKKATAIPVSAVSGKRPTSATRSFETRRRTRRPPRARTHSRSAASVLRVNRKRLARWPDISRRSKDCSGDPERVEGRDAIR